MDWFFSGLGTMIIGLVIGTSCGGIAGYLIGIKKNVSKQSQNAGSGAYQSQIGTIASYDDHKSTSQITIDTSSFRQDQKAGDNAVQIQEGHQR
ncbi:MAG: hypothetical protein FWD03_02555 [Defluviitaleaceae bacterium]|nr:hypothetical protein [Defluviitaleaceae bacterium]